MPGIKEIAEFAGISKKQTAAVFKAVGIMCDHGQNVTIRGFGTFKNRKRPRYIMYNPKSCRMQEVKERIVLTFKEIRARGY